VASKQAASGGLRSLVIVESATKARKIQPYLGKDYVVEASVGHIRDLPKGAADVPAKYKKEPWARLGVNPDDDFEPIYVVSADKKKKVAELKKELAGVDQLLLATDPDREGEAIAWHLLEVLKPKVPVKRMVFHEITKPAILAAAENTRELDTDLVDAQETRRILDRLYGYEVSPVLWKKVMPRLSAGRVQSVATRVIVERERERMAFVAADYWDITAVLATQGGGSAGDAGEPRSFSARLSAVDGTRVAQGRDFGQDGRLKTTGAAAGSLVLGESAATALATALEGADFVVDSVESKPYTRRPYAPFMTSTLQQEAGRKLRYTSERTMRIAQRLYENGYITYMRTDSTTLSESGIAAARAQATELYGSEYVSPSPRQYTRKVKNSQEAHEAIRPAGENFATPGSLHGVLDAEEYRLYELIWQRTVASQMADAKGTTVSVRITGSAGENPSGHREATFAASGRTITFPGFLKAYVEAVDETAEQGATADDAEKRLPRLTEGQDLTGSELAADGHTTSPPARYTEASLVKAMEEMGIGRPSTYASIIRTIQDRGYVYSRGNALVPSWVAFAVVGLLEQNFGRLVDYDFTSLMEDELDAIAEGRENRDDWLRRFYFGAGEGTRGADSPYALGLKNLVDVNLEAIDARSINSIKVFDDSQGRPVHVRVGRFGPYLERMVAGEGGEQESQRANLPEGMSPDELTLEVAEKLFATPQDGRPLGTDPETGHEIVVKDGRFGPYVTEKLPEATDAEKAAWAEKVLAEADAEKKRIDAERDAAVAAAGDDAKAVTEAKKAATKAKAAVTRKAKKDADSPTGPKPRTGSLMQSMDPTTVTLEDALKLLSLPRVVGTDPASGEEITAQLGRYGPYLRKGSDSRTLESEDAVFSITLEQALKIYSEPKRRGRQAAAPKALRELGVDEVSGKQMLVKDGRFGPYVTDGETNASLRKGDTVETLTDARASELLSERRAKAPAKKAPAKRGAAKRPAKKAASRR